MQKTPAKKAFLLFTLLFVLLAVASFALFRDASPVCSTAGSCLPMTSSAQNGQMLWEVVCRQFLTLISI